MKRGRPPKRGQRSSVRIMVNLTPQEAAVVRELAAKRQLSLSDWVRASGVTAQVLAHNPGAALQMIGDDVRGVERPVDSRVIDQDELEKAGQVRLQGV